MQLLEDQQVPLLVVLLLPGLPDAVVDPPGKLGPAVHVRDRDVGDLLPRLVGHPGDQLEDLELRQRPLLSVERVERGEQDAGQHAVRAARRAERLGLRHGELVVTQERRPSRHLGGGRHLGAHHHLDVPPLDSRLRLADAARGPDPRRRSQPVGWQFLRVVSRAAGG